MKKLIKQENSKREACQESVVFQPELEELDSEQLAAVVGANGEREGTSVSASTTVRLRLQQNFLNEIG